MTWTRTDVHFDYPYAIFALSREDFYRHGGSFGGSPKEMAAWCESILAGHRPELAGAVILDLQLWFEANQIRIGVIHKSLPAAKPGEMPVVYPLIPEPEADRVTIQEAAQPARP